MRRNNLLSTLLMIWTWILCSIRGSLFYSNLSRVKWFLILIITEVSIAGEQKHLYKRCIGLKVFEVQFSLGSLKCKNFASQSITLLVTLIANVEVSMINRLIFLFSLSFSSFQISPFYCQEWSTSIYCLDG